MTTAIYPGTFDPVTNGHLDILERAGKIFDRVIIAAAANREKGPLFTLEERLALIRENVAEGAAVEVDDFDGLLVDFARSVGASVIIRGLRAVSDFEFEFQMTQMNRHLDEELETIFLMPTQDYFFTSSGLLRQVARYTDRITDFVPPNVARALEEKLRKGQVKGPGESG